MAKKKRRETIGEGRFMRLVRQNNREFVERTNATGVVAIVALTKDARLVLTDQWREAVGANVIDLPAGLAGDIEGEESEALAVAARRELVEETGYDADDLIELLPCPTSPGLSSEIVTFFRAENARRQGTGGGDESENITVHTVPLGEMPAWIKRQRKANKLIDPKVLAGMLLAMRVV